MIVRNRLDQYVLIQQHDHALLARQLLAHVGNRRFAPPTPLESLATAVAMHDAGWRKIDEHPMLIEGRPRHVFEMPRDPLLEIWSNSVESLLPGDPMATLLCSLHVMSLAAHGPSPERETNSPQSREQMFRSNRFLHRQIEIQEQLRRKLGMRLDLPLRRGLAEAGKSADEDLLRAKFCMMQLLDQISLVICFDRLVFEKIDPVYPRPGTSAIAVHIQQLAEGSFRIDPWPFERDRLEVEFPGKAVPARVYRDEEELGNAYNDAPIEPLTAGLIK